MRLDEEDGSTGQPVIRHGNAAKVPIVAVVTTPAELDVLGTVRRGQ